MWGGNKAQAVALESVMIEGAKRILGCSSKTCNEAVRGDMGLDSLQGHRDKAKLKWWYKVPEHRYSRNLFVQWALYPGGQARENIPPPHDRLAPHLGCNQAPSQHSTQPRVPGGPAVVAEIAVHCFPA